MVWRPACRDSSRRTTASPPEGRSVIAHRDALPLPICSLPAFRRRQKRAVGGWLGAGSPVTALPLSKEKDFTEGDDRRSMTERIECPPLPKERQPLGRSTVGRNPFLSRSSSPKRRFAVRSRYSACRKQHNEAWTNALRQQAQNNPVWRLHPSRGGVIGQEGIRASPDQAVKNSIPERIESVPTKSRQNRQSTTRHSSSPP
jgi:hypothetical protein